jgi:hypothetical protein
MVLAYSFLRKTLGEVLLLFLSPEVFLEDYNEAIDVNRVYTSLTYN